MRRGRHCRGRGRRLRFAGRLHRRRHARGSGQQAVGLCPGQGSHPRARGGRADLRGHEHPGGAHRLAAAGHQAEPAVRGQRLRAFGHSLLRRHQELPVDGAALGAARRGGDHRRRGDRGEHRRRPGRPGVLRDRPAAAFGLPADGQEGRKGRGRRGLGRARGQPPALEHRRLLRLQGSREHRNSQRSGEGPRAGASGRQVRHQRGGLPFRRAGSGAGRPRPRPRIRPLHGHRLRPG